MSTSLQAAELFGVKLVGITPENGRKLLLSLALVVALVAISALVRSGLGVILRRPGHERAKFWARQSVQLAVAVLLVVGLLSIWFEDPGRLAGALGLVTAGVAIALQRVITSFAAYLIILRGRVFTVGDRITMGSVRGDVVALGFMQTTIMEMGQAPGEQRDDPSLWVAARQYTGRIVRVTNDKIFDSPVYNYTVEFPYLWEELTLPVAYRDDRRRAEEILLDVARRHTVRISEVGEEAMRELRRRYFLPGSSSLEPRVYWRLTDNWLELTVRFIAGTHGIRELKDAMSRDILAALDEAKIGIASATFEIVGVPPIRIGEGG